MKRPERVRENGPKGALAASPSSRLGLVLDVPDAALARHVTATGTRIGIDVRVDRGGRGLSLENGTIAHALRVIVLSDLSGPLTLAANTSSRARRFLDRHVQAGPPTGRTGATLREEADGRITLLLRDRLPIDLGEPSEANAALREARAEPTRPGGSAEIVLPPDAEERARAIVFGPTRRLSEPSSRRVLEAFGIPGATWRLAENAARAAVHARAIGYPVDLRVATPDASAIDAPTLSASSLRSPGEVRDAFRAITREVRRTVESARVLGVTVARHLPTLPRLRLVLEQAAPSRKLRIELDDPIGRKLTHPLEVAAPTDPSATLAALARFEGREVLPEPDSPRGRALVEVMVRFARTGLILADALIRAEMAIAPMEEGDGWALFGARLDVRGVDVAADLEEGLKTPSPVRDS
jgi:hypothetical protein